MCVYRNVLVPAWHGVVTAAVATYTYVLTPVGHGVVAVSTALYRGSVATARAVGRYESFTSVGQLTAGQCLLVFRRRH